MASSRVVSRVALAGVLVIAALLVFTSLDDRYLWDDEAENALLAQRILTYGIPIARDGRDFVSQGCGWDADANYLWTYHPWLPMYLAAGSFAVLGPSTFAARLPFAILGWLSVVSIYVLGRRLFADRMLAVLAAASLALSVPFLLHVRQSRYYAITVFAAVWMIYFFVGMLERRRGSLAGLVAASTAMFHANHPMVAAMFAGLTVGALVLPVDWRALLRPFLAVALTVLGNLTWILIYGRGWTVAFAAKTGESVGAKLLAVVPRFHAYLQRADVYALPGMLLALFAVWVLIEGRATTRTPAFRACLFLLVSALVFLACVSVLPFTFFRFMLSALPAFVLIQAFMIRTLAGRRPVIAAVLLVLALGTDVLHGWSVFGPSKLTFSRQAVGSALLSYGGELTHHVAGPIERIVTYVRREARPGQSIFISYGDLPLRFYTPLRVYGGQNCDPLPVAPPPDWVVVRFFLRFPNPAPGSADAIARMRRYVERELPWDRYEKVDLGGIDVVWDSIPEPAFHQFSAPAQGNALTIWKRVR